MNTRSKSDLDSDFWAIIDRNWTAERIGVLARLWKAIEVWREKIEK